jgi:hypothetical protein
MGLFQHGSQQRHERLVRLQRNYVVLATLLSVSLSIFATAADGPDSATVRGDSTTTRKRLAEVEQKVLGPKPAEALDELQRILDEVGDDLVSADNVQFSSHSGEVAAILGRYSNCWIVMR